jgi:hypothetical protein
MLMALNSCGKARALVARQKAINYVGDLHQHVCHSRGEHSVLRTTGDRFIVWWVLISIFCFILKHSLISGHPLILAGTMNDWAMASRICCNNHRYAEPRGWLDTQGMFGNHILVEAANTAATSTSEPAEIVFYDSSCGKPLFVAPRGRTMDAFRQESREHGWPSFRQEEIVSANVRIASGGRMTSVRCSLPA